ncbi:MAG TPA: wax ester/triacylglycerol synthase family O-acyltransferase [Solirubrobacteraceae bacterium]|nr:wax ester/triacylglycerol synthase family O-acyltransferase [Solirubrobacteraceae bacterium]
MQQLSALDTQFLALETDRNYGHVGSVALLDPSTAPGGSLTLDGLKGMLEPRLHLVPPLTQRLVPVPFGLDWPYWVHDDHFDLGHHVRELALPAPGTREQLAEQVSRIYSRRLDRARPLWELYLVQGLEGGMVALVTKIHHAAIDGLSGAEVMTILYDLAPEGREIEPPAPDAADGEQAPGNAAMFVRGLAGLPRYPFTVSSRLTRLLPHVDVVPSLLGMPGSETVSRTMSRVRRAVTSDERAQIIERPALRAPRGPYGAKLSPHRIFGLGSLSLDEVKQVKSHFEVKVNDVVCSLVAGALREHLRAHGELPEGPLLAQIPVSVRTEQERGTFGNQISLMIVAIPTHLADPAERLRDMHEQLRAAKDRHHALPAKALSDVSTFIPPALHARGARAVLSLSAHNVVRPPFNVIISNVPGPPIPIYTAGAKLEALYPLSIVADGSGLNVTVMSYREAIDVGITADREQTPDVQSIVEGMAGELADLLALVG